VNPLSQSFPQQFKPVCSIVAKVFALRDSSNLSGNCITPAKISMQFNDIPGKNKKKRLSFKFIIIRFLIIISICFTLQIFSGCSNSIKKAVKLDELPRIFPDYTSLVIPPNISPLNFNIEEKGTEFFVEISSKTGKKISIRQSSPKIKIPPDKWKNLLNNNKGNSLIIDIYTKQDKWYKYSSITDTIAPETIDNHLVYRLIGIIYMDGDKLGIYQRNLETFDESVIFENTSISQGACINCHSFSNNNPGKMSMHIRKKFSGTVIYDNGKYTKYNTKTEYTMAPAAYTAWHPNGEVIAFSLNRLYVYFTSNEDKLVEVSDLASDLVLFNIKTNTISTSPNISGPSRECLPNWSPDGKWLYFISTPKAGKDMSSWVFTKYDLLRIPFDPEKTEWGDIDTLLTSKQTGMSITWPAASPDGRYILFCMIDHGYFSIFDKNSDLYLLDLKTGQYRKTDIINSTSTDSYHAWSKNGRWIVFSSKRLDDLSTRPYFAYFDKDGNFHKPFVLPQEDPLFYKNYPWNYNLPALVNGKVTTDTAEFKNIIIGNPKDVKFDQSVEIDTTSLHRQLTPDYY
jgi:hypothetical protein